MALLRQFHALNLQGKLSAYDCYKALDLQTNGAGLLKLPDRLPMFMLMIREWHFTKMLKRGGRGLDPTGIAGTKQGELAVKCPACPRPGVNLPSNWMDAPPEKAYANFRLKSRLRTSEDSDPPLGSGFAYFVESKSYGQYVVEYTSEEEISTCVAFAALATANLKQTKGLASTGVGAVTCGRHQFWRANGLGDLQKGERYLNMDYIFLSTLMDVIIKTLVASYDLACQWKKKFWQRVANFPNAIQESLSDADVVFLLAPRRWGRVRAGTPSVISVAFSNWRRMVGMGSSLLRKVLEAIPNAIYFHHSYKEMDDGLRSKRPEQVEEWDAMFAAWNEGKENNPSPFTAPRAKKSMQEIWQELKEVEHAIVVVLGCAGCGCIET
ncbi:hypothetical protein EWM64_g3387 [Hericium alpestre]|uniref:CxC2-like cysteine cluster KDZ transposase-associated domain-containing protein n=1 Tax=Hericium alpestre TaxID=135208 RepID=A0A4Z0A2T5_9AGAM|nr:hypothetical protein EWM64_g3387 [Hericium alpestre]